MSKAGEPLVRPGQVLRTLSEDAAAAMTKAWMQVYGRRGQGLNMKDFMWHVFSGGGYDCVSGQEALAAYATRQAAEYVVLSNDRRTVFVTDVRPDRAALSDYMVFPSNLAWTMAFTHEDGWLGPYFAVHPDAARLEADILAGIRKKQQIEAARAKGWI
ncbi:DUF4275 family protein [Roseateles sp. So40a]|uniref:DUF4275 family protein n=1 Tax=Roseateles sp. So40a TaxID=3400226 RepID=UPI003A8A6937